MKTAIVGRAAPPEYARSGPARGSGLRVFLFALLVLAVTAGCSTDRDVLARVNGINLTLADLDQELVRQPAAERTLPAGAEASDWLESKLRRLALATVLSAEATSLSSTPEARAIDLSQRAGLAATTLLNQLASNIQVSEAEVAERVGSLAQNTLPEPVLDFQHIFFRTVDQANPAARRAAARRVLEQARSGEDFTALAEQHSDSANASAGGLVRNAKPSLLDPTVSAALGLLSEGEVSELIESRTGLHLFRLVRRLQPAARPETALLSTARAALQRERVQAAQEELLQELRQRVPVNVADASWTIGDTVIEPEVVAALLPTPTEAAKQALVDRLLLADEATRLGLAEAADTKTLELQLERTLLDRAFNKHRVEYDANLDAAPLRDFYNAQPSLFSVPATLHVQLIFVPQGKDSFATQLELEREVAELRRTGEFMAAAQRLSTHPSAAAGGDLGWLTEMQLGRYNQAIIAATLNLEAGAISDPIYCTGRVLSTDPLLLRGGFAVIRIVERKPSVERTFEEAIEDVRRQYAQQNRDQLDAEIQDALLQEAGFEVVRLPELSELSI